MRHDGRVADAVDRREADAVRNGGVRRHGARSSPAPRATTRGLDIGLTEEAGKLGIAGVLGRLPVLQPAVAGRASKRTSGRSPAPPTSRWCSTTSPFAPGARSTAPRWSASRNDVPNIVGVKDAAGNPGATAAVKANTPADFEVYSGDDAMTLPLLAIGAVGAIGVATHWCAPDQVEMFDAWDRGDVLTAQRINARQLESFEFETGDARAEPGTVEGHDAHTRSRRRRVPVADGPHPRRPRSRRPTGLRPVGRGTWLTPTATSASPSTHRGAARLRCASCSSAGSARSAATAWRSSRAPSTIPIARSSSSTAG